MVYTPPSDRRPTTQPAAKRNIGLILGGLALLGVGFLAFLVFAYNAWQYATVEDRFSSLGGSKWVVDLVKERDLERMIIFGPVAGVLGVAGLVLALLGLRKRQGSSHLN